MSKPDNTYEELRKREAYEADAHRPSFNDFSEYVAAHPKGEGYRAWVTGSGTRQYILFPCHKEQCGLPGDYYFAYIYQEYRRLSVEEHKKGQNNNKMTLSGTYALHVNDCDDFGANKTGLTLEQAIEEMENLKLLAPFYINELAEFGYGVY